MSDFKTYTRICVDCGKVLNNVGRSAQRCPECGKKHANALSLEWNRRRNEELQAQRQGLAAERSSFASAVSHGLSGSHRTYKYTFAREHIDRSEVDSLPPVRTIRKKPAGAPTPTSCKG